MDNHYVYTQTHAYTRIIIKYTHKTRVYTYNHYVYTQTHAYARTIITYTHKHTRIHV